MRRTSIKKLTNAKLYTYLPDEIEVRNALRDLPRISAVVCYAGFTTETVAYARTEVIDGEPTPLVWEWDDHNGVYEDWTLIPITSLTSGGVYCWTSNEKAAKRIAEQLNVARGEAWRNSDEGV